MKIKMFGVICLSILVIVLTSLLMVYALSPETKELVNDLRWKHSGLTLISDDIFDVQDLVYEWWSINFDTEAGILYVETNDGKWFVKMQKKEE